MAKIFLKTIAKLPNGNSPNCRIKLSQWKENSPKELYSKIDMILNHANEYMLSCKDTFDNTDEYYNIVECVDYSKYTDLKYENKLYNEIENPICVTII